MNLPTRKPSRLPGYDYNTPGAYFITICTQNKECILADIQMRDLVHGPDYSLTDYGRIVDKAINTAAHPGIVIEKYVVMPNHLHLLLHLEAAQMATVDSPANNPISRYVSALKRRCNHQIGRNIFQRSYHDHIVRGDEYLKIWEYIDTNPIRWDKDCFHP